MQLLLEAGASVNQANQSGWAPLHQATRLGHHRMARLLLDWGAELGSGTSRHNTTQVSEEYYSVIALHCISITTLSHLFPYIVMCNAWQVSASPLDVSILSRCSSVVTRSMSSKRKGAKNVLDKSIGKSS